MPPVSATGPVRPSGGRVVKNGVRVGSVSYGPVADIAQALDDVVIDEIESWQSAFGGKRIARPA